MIAKRVVERPVLLAIIFAIIAIVGTYTLSDVSIDLFPDIDMPMIVVSTSYEGAGPQSVEKSVTAVLESSLVSLNGLKEITSTSSEGSGDSPASSRDLLDGQHAGSVQYRHHVFPKLDDARQEGSEALLEIGWGGSQGVPLHLHHVVDPGDEEAHLLVLPVHD